MKALLCYKRSEISSENLIEKFEEILGNYPDLLEEAFLFLDHKRVKKFV